MNGPVTPARLSRMHSRPAGRGQHQLWQTMRVRRKQGVEWTLDDLETLCEGAMVRGAMTRYVTALVQAGYVTRSARRARHNNGWRNLACHRLVRDTGPLAPRLFKTTGRSARIYDPNTERVVDSDAAADEARPGKDAGS